MELGNPRSWKRVFKQLMTVLVDLPFVGKANTTILIYDGQDAGITPWDRQAF